MPRNREMVVVGVILVAFWHWSSDAPACSCIPPPHAAEAFDQADAVFLGRIVDESHVDGRDPYSLIRLDVEVMESWKGVDTSYVSVYTASDTAACGLPAGVGRTLVFYVFRDPFDGRGHWTVSLCSRTGLVDEVLEDVDEFARLGIAPLALRDVDPPASSFMGSRGLICGNGAALSLLGVATLLRLVRFTRSVKAAATDRFHH